MYILFVNFITSGLQLLNIPQGQATGAERIRQVLVNAWCVRYALDCGVAGALVDQLGPQTPRGAATDSWGAGGWTADSAQPVQQQQARAEAAAQGQDSWEHKVV